MKKGIFHFTSVHESLEIDGEFVTMEKSMSENCLLPAPSASNYFFEILEYEFSRAVRYKNVVTLMFIKLCHLDEIVRTYGQTAADSIMSEIERIIQCNIRNTDREFMYGKDEFMIILPNTPKRNATSIIPKLQRLIENYRYPNGRATSLNLAPRFGLASYPDPEDNVVDHPKRGDITRNSRKHSVINLPRCNASS